MIKLFKIKEENNLLFNNGNSIFNVEPIKQLSNCLVQDTIIKYNYEADFDKHYINIIFPDNSNINIQLENKLESKFMNNINKLLNSVTDNNYLYIPIEQNLINYMETNCFYNPNTKQFEPIKERIHIKPNLVNWFVRHEITIIEEY